MERHFSGNFIDRRNKSVVPIILYLTLPNVTHQGQWKDNQTQGRWRSRKQQQRDQKRMDNFIESKTTCSNLPFYSLDNKEIKEMIPSPTFTKKPKSAQFYLSEIKKLNQENMQLKSKIIDQEDLIKENESLISCIQTLRDSGDKMKEEITYIQSEIERNLDDKNMTINKLVFEYANLHLELQNEQTVRKKIEVEYSQLKESTSIHYDKEIEHNREINKLHTEEVNALKSEIKCLKSELSRAKSNATDSVKVHVPKHTSSTNRTDAHQGLSTHKKETPVNSQKRSTTENNKLVPGCRKCGSKVYHKARQCPAKNFTCAECSKKGHHTINCMLICSACGEKKEDGCPTPADCIAQYLSCIYCNIQGHLDYVCPQKRFDELGY